MRAMPIVVKLIELPAAGCQLDRRTTSGAIPLRGDVLMVHEVRVVCSYASIENGPAYVLSIGSISEVGWAHLDRMRGIGDQCAFLRIPPHAADLQFLM